VTLALSYLGGAAIIAMTGVTLFDIIARNFFGFAVFGTYDLVLITLVISVYAGMAEAFRQQAHITVDMIDGIRSYRLRRFIGITAIVITILSLMLLTWLCIGQAYDSWRFGDFTTDLRVPKYLFWIGIVVGMALSCVVLLVLLAEKVRTGEAPQDSATIIEETQA
jgi:TRAP-type C4-dicarboxylate transport system permease small subunit